MTATPNTSNDDDTGVLGQAAASAVDDGNASSGRSINPPMTPSQQITAPSPLQRAPSVTSTHGHSNGGRGVGGTMSFTNNTNGTTMASFPASPAVSTLSKYSSSGSSSLASANNNRMSVDDILGNSKLSLEGRRRRRSRERPSGATVVTGSKDGKVTGGIRPSPAAASMHPSSGGGEKVGHAGGNTNNATSRSTNTNEQTPSAAAGATKKKRPRRSNDNTGREERKRRLEHLQREQLLRQRLGGGQQVGAKKKRRASNDHGGLSKLERMKSEESEDCVKLVILN